MCIDISWDVFVKLEVMRNLLMLITANISDVSLKDTALISFLRIQRIAKPAMHCKVDFAWYCCEP